MFSRLLPILLKISQPSSTLFLELSQNFIKFSPLLESFTKISLQLPSFLLNLLIFKKLNAFQFPGELKSYALN